MSSNEDLAQSFSKKSNSFTSSLECDSSQLPIWTVKNQLLKRIEESPVLVVTGETGSGKSTQIAKYLFQSGYRKIAVTQPRRVGAISLATRVSEELGVKLGSTVGYTVRFDDCSGRDTQIKYLTDGCLLRESLVDKMLQHYNVIILDEAHERSLQTDILFGLVFQMIKNRLAKKESTKTKKPFRLIITSATLNVEKFCSFFQCTSFSIPGRNFPVEIRNSEEAPRHFMRSAVETVISIHRKYEPEGHVLVFLTGRDEIDAACDLLGRKVDSLIDDGVDLPDIVILPAYSTLRASEQKKIFYKPPPKCRKVVFATNIAETSLTVPGVRFVVDCGFVKQKIFNEATGITSLVVVPISQVAAIQRAGRAGRTCPGVCFRLYSADNYARLRSETPPEITRSSLPSVVLLLKAMGIEDPLEFPFLDSPPPALVLEGLRDLFFLDAITADGRITLLGREMAKFPLDPPLAKLLLCALRFGCTETMLTIAAMLSVEKLWQHYTDKESIEHRERSRHGMQAREGDHFSLAGIYRSWEKSGFDRDWTEAHDLNYWSLVQARNVRLQLAEILRRLSGERLDKLNKFIGDKPGHYFIESNDDERQKCQKILANVFFANSCRFLESNKKGVIYRPLAVRKKLGNNSEVNHLWMHKSCALVDSPPEWIIFDHVVFTSKPYMQQVSKISFEWISDLLPKLKTVNTEKLLGKHFYKHQIDENRNENLKSINGSPHISKNNKTIMNDRYLKEKRKISESKISSAKARYDLRKSKKLKNRN